MINEGAHGYGKFGIPDITLDAFMSKFHMIESSLNRKLSMNMMFDNVKSGKMAASRLVKIMLNNLEHETAVDVLQDAYRFIIPASLNKYLHTEVN